MALALAPLTFARAVVAAPGTSVIARGAGDVAAPVPDNCHTVLVTNTSTLSDAYVGTGVAGAALTAGIGAALIPAGATLTLGIGPRAVRGSMDQAEQAGSGLIFDGAAALTLVVTYLNQLGQAR